MNSKGAADSTVAGRALDPTVSVIMPVRNEAGHIASSLGAVLAQDYPPDRLEVIVVDGESDDGTQGILQQVIVAHPSAKTVSVALLSNPRRQVSASLNLALEKSGGEVIVRVDGHCRIPSDYLALCVENLLSTSADCAGGVLETVGEGPVGSAIATALASPFGVGNARFRYARKAGWVDTVAFGAYRREVFDRLGDFDEELVRNQDDEMNFRLVASGGGIWLDPRIRIVYHGRTSLSDLWQQYFEYGLYKIRVMQKRGGVAEWRHVVPAGFVSALVLLTSIWVSTGRRKPIALFCGTYCAASLLAAVHATRTRPHLVVLVVAAFGTMHLAYGIGFLVGAWRWRQNLPDIFLGRT